MKLKTILSVVFLNAAALVASPIIDQNQAVNDTYMAGFGQSDLAQSFKQTNGNITGAGIFLQDGIGSSDTVTISLWDALPNNSGTMLATGSVFGTAGTWADVSWASVVLNTSSTYFLVFSGNTSLGIAGSTSNPYADGMVFANSGFGAFSGYDYTFRTYAEGASSVPDSTATLPVVMMALMGLLVVKNRRRA